MLAGNKLALNGYQPLAVASQRLRDLELGFRQWRSKRRRAQADVSSAQCTCGWHSDGRIVRLDQHRVGASGAAADIGIALHHPGRSG